MRKFTVAGEALEWVMARRNSHHPFSHVRSAFQKAGNPQDCFKSVHIAGTNGKGSTCNLIAAMLQAKGFTVGLFTSPHLITHEDRIRINGIRIRPETFMRLLNNRLDLIEEYEFGMFEIDFLIASDYFREKRVDYAVIETGIGGRFDTTNTIKAPLLSVVTSIGFDHMNLLGNTIEEIAGQKAGIFKENGKGLIGNLLPEAEKVMREEAALSHTGLTLYEPYEDAGCGKMIWRGVMYELAAAGEYQKHNTVLALQAIELLGFDPAEETILDVVRRTSWAGRFEILGHEPLLILDGAHNEEGMLALTESLGKQPRPVVAVFSALKDKQGKLLRGILNRAAERVIVTSINSPRAADPASIALAEDRIIPDLKQAVKEAVRLAGPGGTVIICGSLYLISEAELILQNKE